MTVDPKDQAQNRYHVHQRPSKPGESKHCMCASCVTLRRERPRTAATIDGMFEQERRAHLYRKGEFG